MQGPSVVELAPTVPGLALAVWSCAPQGFQVDGDGHVRAFPGHGGTIGGVQVAPGQLMDGISPALRGGSQIVPTLRSQLGVDDRLQRGEDGLPALGVELAFHPNHSGRGGAGAEASPVSENLRVLQRILFVQRLRPLTHHPAKFSHRTSHRCLHQGRLAGRERIRVNSSSLRDDPHCIRGHRSLRERLPHLGHLLQSLGHADLLTRRTGPYPKAIREPRRG